MKKISLIILSTLIILGTLITPKKAFAQSATPTTGSTTTGSTGTGSTAPSSGEGQYSIPVPIAAGAIPPPYVPCTDTGDPEFHSLRPYQASPCQTTVTPTAKFCGNELTFHDTIPESYPGGKGDCVPNNNGGIICTYNEIITKSLTIDLSGAKLPIMGNTENVPNSQTPTGSPPPLSDADKVNGYVSWYLNGVMNRAEDGGTENTDKNIVNFSGPLNKLLPGAILDAQRIKTINNVDANVNHNQIVVCGNSNVPIFGNLLNIGTFTPTECYTGDDSKAKGEVFKLKRWNGGLSLFNSVTNGLATLVNKIAEILPESTIPRSLVEEYIRTAWNKRTPPLPWDDGTGKPFATEDLYTKAYNEWRGRTCVIIPVINKVVCFENILVPNTYADLYPYIPLSSTEDLMGQIKVDAVSSATSSTTGGVTVSGVGFSKQTPSTLFFPHMQESSDLAGTLQNTFVPKGQEQVGSPTNVASGTTCKSVEVRSNNGDKLFATQLTGDLTYTANFSCEFTPVITTTTTTTNGKACVIVGGTCVPSDWGCSTSHGSMDCGQGFQCGVNCSSLVPVQTCTKDVYISLSTTGSIPLVDDIWSRLVAGPMAVFKRIFPKTNTPGSVGQIIDIPGSTNITYTGLGISQQNADLKFPHIGGISEYFLKGIQTALRPKGYGEPISFGPTTGNPVSCTGGELPALPAASGACKICGYDLSPTFQRIIESASQTFGVPGSVILGTMYHEGAFSRGLDWSEENVKKWSVCGGEIPGCDKNAMSTAQIPFGWIPYYFYDDSNLWGAVGKVDPSRTKENVSPCNVLDGVYATAAALKMWSGGLSTNIKFPLSMDPGQTYSRFPDMCYGWDLNNGSGTVTSCGAWNANTIATSQVGYGGWCPEPGKHPIQPYFPDGAGWISQTVNYFNQYTCR